MTFFLNTSICILCVCVCVCNVTHTHAYILCACMHVFSGIHIQIFGCHTESWYLTRTLVPILNYISTVFSLHDLKLLFLSELSAMIRGAENGSTFLCKDYKEEDIPEILKTFFADLSKWKCSLGRTLLEGCHMTNGVSVPDIVHWLYTILVRNGGFFSVM